MNSISYTLSNEEYHKHPAFSSSFLRDLVTGTASKAHWNRMHPTPPNPAMELGTLIHTLVLEPESFESRYMVLPESHNGRTKEGKERLIEAETLSKTPLKHNQNQALDLLRSNIENSPDYEVVRKMRGRGRPEASLFWEDWLWGEQLCLKSRPDWLWESEGVLFDLKTTADASPLKFGRKAADLAYCLQAYMGMRGFEAITGQKPAGFVWIVIENTPPYDIARYDMEEDALWAGEILFKKAVHTLHQCRKNNYWPAYDTSPNKLPLSAYYLNYIGELTYD